MSESNEAVASVAVASPALDEQALATGQSPVDQTDGSQPGEAAETTTAEPTVDYAEYERLKGEAERAATLERTLKKLERANARLGNRNHLLSQEVETLRREPLYDKAKQSFERAKAPDVYDEDRVKLLTEYEEAQTRLGEMERATRQALTEADQLFRQAWQDAYRQGIARFEEGKGAVPVPGTEDLFDEFVEAVEVARQARNGRDVVEAREGLGAVFGKVQQNKTIEEQASKAAAKRIADLEAKIAALEKRNAEAAAFDEAHDGNALVATPRGTVGGGGAVLTQDEFNRHRGDPGWLHANAERLEAAFYRGAIRR